MPNPRHSHLDSGSAAQYTAAEPSELDPDFDQRVASNDLSSPGSVGGFEAIDRLIERHGPTAICNALANLLTDERIRRIDAILDTRLCSVITCVEDTYDPHNATAAIRTIEALGLQELHVVEAANRFSIAAGVTRGAHRWIDLVRWSNPADAVGALRGRGFRVYATAPSAAALIENVDVATPIAVVFGNEHAGVSPAAIAACDGTIRVPMFGFTESFNLSVSVGMVMSRIAARRREWIGIPGDLEADRRARLRARWFAQRVRGAIGVLERALG